MFNNNRNTIFYNKEQLLSNKFKLRSSLLLTNINLAILIKHLMLSNIDFNINRRYLLLP